MNLSRMMSFKKWMSCQLGSTLLSLRHFYLFEEDCPSGEPSVRDPTTVNAEDVVNSASADEGSQNLANPQVTATSTSTSTPYPSQYSCVDTMADPLTRIEALQMKFLRLLHRFGVLANNSVVAQALYRLQLVNSICVGESDASRPVLDINKARYIAAEQEKAGVPSLSCSMKILLLGKSGVGKSSIVNSIFGQSMVATDAFLPGTKKIEEVQGSIEGINVTFIDTPGLLLSCPNQQRNRKLLHAIRRFIKRSPPDIVLYVDRLDHTCRGGADLPLVKLITDVLGSSIWLNTLVALTHCSSPLPEGPNGYPLDFEVYTRFCTTMAQLNIQNAVSNMQLKVPVLFFENHPSCRKNNRGEKVLPNGQVWRSQFLLLCTVTKVLGEANLLLKHQNRFELSPTNPRLPSLPHLLSSFLRPHSSSSVAIDIPADDALDDEEDEYDKLPPIRILTKAQFNKLSRDQKKSYLEELDYRETLFLKKQWKEERRSAKLAMAQASEAPADEEYESSSGEVVQFSEMPVPATFDSDHPSHRYRCLQSYNQWLFGPVLEPHGWDHDICFDGINFEAHTSTRTTHTVASISGQLNKDKEDLRILSESSLKCSTSEGHSVLGGLDVRSSGKDIFYTLHGDIQVPYPSWNTGGAGMSVTKFGDMYFLGMKLEDSVNIGRRLRLAANAGRLAGLGQQAHGGSMELTIRGNDYPVRDEKTTVGATTLSYENETVLGASVQSDFRIGLGSKMSIAANLNSRQMGQLCVKATTSTHAEVALVAAVSLIRYLFRRRSEHAVE